MVFSIDQIKDEQLDILKEIGNIGAGHAATALSKIVQMKIDMKVPRVKMIELSEFEELIGGEDKVVVGIFLRLEGDMEGNIFYIMPVLTAKKLLEKLLNTTLDDDNDFSEIEISAIHEFGNIIASSYISSLADFTKLSLYVSVPSMTIDLANSILSFGIIPISQVCDFALLIDTTFQEGEEYIEGQFFLIPDPEAYSVLFSSLGVPLI